MKSAEEEELVIEHHSHSRYRQSKRRVGVTHRSELVALTNVPELSTDGQ